MQYAVVIEKARGNHSACVPDLPGCAATGTTIEEAEAGIREAIALHRLGMRADGLAIPEPASRVGYAGRPAQAAPGFARQRQRGGDAHSCPRSSSSRSSARTTSSHLAAQSRMPASRNTRMAAPISRIWSLDHRNAEVSSCCAASQIASGCVWHRRAKVVRAASC